MAGAGVIEEDVEGVGTAARKFVPREMVGPSREKEIVKAVGAASGKREEVVVGGRKL